MKKKFLKYWEIEITSITLRRLVSHIFLNFHKIWYIARARKKKKMSRSFEQENLYLVQNVRKTFLCIIIPIAYIQCTHDGSIQVTNRMFDNE